MKVIWKFQLQPSDKPQIIEVPHKTKLLSAHAQNNIPTIWGEVNDFDQTDTSKDKITILVLGTGHKVDDFEYEKFLGTVLLNNEQNVYHVYKLK